MDLSFLFTATTITGMALLGLGAFLMAIDRVNRGIEDFGIIGPVISFAGIGLIIAGVVGIL